MDDKHSHSGKIQRLGDKLLSFIYSKRVHVKDVVSQPEEAL